MISNNYATINLYSNVKADATYEQLCHVDLTKLTPTASMANASVVKLTNPIRFNVKNNNYLDVYNCNYMAIETNNQTLMAFIDDVKYINEGVCLISYTLDYFNTYYDAFKNASLFVEQTTADLKNDGYGALDTTTLDHTPPATLLKTATKKPLKEDILAYYYQTKNSDTITPPKVIPTWKNLGTPNLFASDNEFLKGNTTLFNSYDYGTIPGSLADSIFTYQQLALAKGDNSYNLGLSSAKYENIGAMLADPKLFNSDGSSKIVRAEIHERYTDKTPDKFALSVYDDSNKVFNYENPFCKYVLNIGSTKQEIPSRFMRPENKSIEIKHRLLDTAGAPDLFIINGAQDDDSLANTIEIPKLTRPLILSGTWSKFYKQRNRLNAEAQTLVNNITSKVSSFLISPDGSLTNALINKNNQDTNTNATATNSKTKNNNNLNNNNANNDTTNSFNRQTLKNNQSLSKQQIANSLATSIANINRETDTAVKNLKASQANALENLNISQATKRTNLSLNQQVQKTNLANNYNTTDSKIDISTLDNFFKTGVGAVLSGSFKSALEGVLLTMMNGAADNITAHAINDLNFNGQGAKNQPAGAMKRLDSVQKAQTQSQNNSINAETENLKRTQAVELSNLSTSNATKIYTNQNNANNSYSNKLLEFQTQQLNLELNYNKTKELNSNNYNNANANINADQALSLQLNANNWKNNVKNILNNAINEGRKLVVEINNEINNFNLKISALIADTKDDLTVLGNTTDGQGEFDSGTRDVTLAMYYQGETVNNENHQLIKQSGQTVNHEEIISDLLNLGEFVHQPIEDVNGDKYVYIKGRNLRGLYQMPNAGREKIKNALENGVKIYL